MWLPISNWINQRGSTRGASWGPFNQMGKLRGSTNQMGKLRGFTRGQAVGPINQMGKVRYNEGQSIEGITEGLIRGAHRGSIRGAINARIFNLLARYQTDPVGLRSLLRRILRFGVRWLSRGVENQDTIFAILKLAPRKVAYNPPKGMTQALNLIRLREKSISFHSWRSLLLSRVICTVRLQGYHWLWFRQWSNLRGYTESRTCIKLKS